MHIGLIGGIGPAATDFYHRGLIERHHASNIPLDLTIAYADVRVMSRNLNENGPTGRPRSSPGWSAGWRRGWRPRPSPRWAAISASRSWSRSSPLPLINGLDPVNDAINQRGLKRVGIIGTRVVMASKLYGKITKAEVIAPEGDEFERVQQCYGDMASIGRVTDEQRQTFFEAGRRLADRGAEAVLLGGTDLFLAFTGHDCGFPVMDCADVHIDAIYKKSSA